MSSARSAIRQEIGKRIPGVLVGTASSESTTSTLYDTNEEMMVFAGDGTPDYTGYWLILPAGSTADRVRRVSRHDSAAGFVKPSRAWSTPPASGDTYELWPPDLRPTDVDAAINKALPRLTYLKEQALTLVSGTNTYSLASYTWIENERQVLEVYDSWTNSGTTIRREYPWFKVFRNATAFTLHVWPIPRSVSGHSVVMETLARYATLSTDAATTDAPLEWIAAAGAVELYKTLRRRTSGQDLSSWERELSVARGELRMATRKYAPRRGRRIMPRTPVDFPNQNSVRGEVYY